MRLSEFSKFVHEREQIRMRRAKGIAKPWTKDEILQQYRFCNVRREDDAVTRWIAANWRKPHENDPHLWFAMIVARLFNNPEALEALSYPTLSVEWFRNARECLLFRRDSGLKNFNPAYIVSTNGISMDKITYLFKHVFEPLLEKALHENISASLKGATLREAHELLKGRNGLGSFLAAQVVADLKYATLRDASDWSTFAASGPGSRRGLNRVCGYDHRNRWSEAAWQEKLRILHVKFNEKRDKAVFPKVIHAQDIQNCLCEFDKYERVRLNQGAPKQLYPGRKGE